MPRWDDDGVRAQTAGLAAAHGGLHAVPLGLVAGGEHDPTTDDHRPAAQRRIVSLLDRRVERVEIGMEDRRLRSHEHMFARDGVRWQWAAAASSGGESSSLPARRTRISP